MSLDVVSEEISLQDAFNAISVYVTQFAEEPSQKELDQGPMVHIASASHPKNDNFQIVMKEEELDGRVNITRLFLRAADDHKVIEPLVTVIHSASGEDSFNFSEASDNESYRNEKNKHPFAFRLDLEIFKGRREGFRAAVMRDIASELVNILD